MIWFSHGFLRFVPVLIFCFSGSFVRALPAPGTPGTAVTAASDSLRLRLPVIKYQLENGLTVLLHRDTTVPIVSYHTWYKVGSLNEAEGITGAAHMLEHMMFKGAKKYSGKDFDHIIHENGIVNNAFTTYDYTGFYQNLPPDKLELVMDLEVDRMSSLTIDPAELLKERDVVKEERRWRVDNNPMGLLRELTMSTIFKQHPYRWPVIGTMEDISNYEAPVLRRFYEQYYVPNNAILVLVGDIDIERTKSLIQKYYGKLPRKALPEIKYPDEPPQQVQYNAKLKQEVQGITFNVSFRGVPLGHPDSYALDLAAQILGSGASSRLYKRLVYQSQVAAQAFSYHSNMKDHGVFAVGVVLKPNQDMEKPLEASYNEIYRLRTQPVSDKEIKKAKIQVMKSVVDELMTVDGKARALASAEIVTGSYENLLTDIEKYNRVSPADVQRVAAKYLNTTQRSIVVLEPKSSQKIPVKASDKPKEEAKRK
ncbi:MAG: insulinase family protein [Bdellovibrionaceae bacterium]|nr:insulinase family protein [Pseudobdellovibrionaceae bacterium]